MLKEIWEKLKYTLLEALKAAWKEFLRVLWDFTKDDVILSARKSLGTIKSYLNSSDGKEKKEQIIDLIMTKIKLPVILKPFKCLIKKVLKNKLDEILEETINKAEAAANNFKITG